MKRVLIITKDSQKIEIECEKPVFSIYNNIGFEKDGQLIAQFFEPICWFFIDEIDNNRQNTTVDLNSVMGKGFNRSQLI